MHITPELEAELNAEPVEKAVDKVLDGIDAAKVRDQVIEIIDRGVVLHEISYVMHENNTEAIADEILKHFIITPRIWFQMRM